MISFSFLFLLPVIISRITSNYIEFFPLNVGAVWVVHWIWIFFPCHFCASREFRRRWLTFYLLNEFPSKRFNHIVNPGFRTKGLKYRRAFPPERRVVSDRWAATTKTFWPMVAALCPLFFSLLVGIRAPKPVPTLATGRYLVLYFALYISNKLRRQFTELSDMCSHLRRGEMALSKCRELGSGSSHYSRLNLRHNIK